MKIKKYEGKSWPEALQRMKEDLGPNAVIIYLPREEPTFEDAGSLDGGEPTFEDRPPDGGPIGDTA